MKKKELLVVSYGTTAAISGEEDIGHIEMRLREAFPEYEVHRAFASGAVLAQIRGREGISVDSVAEALQAAEKRGVRRLAVQPTHLTGGGEYTKLLELLKREEGRFERMAVGRPLLDSDSDLVKAAAILSGETRQFDDGKTVVCLIAHGTGAEKEHAFAYMQQILRVTGQAQCYVGVLRGGPGLEEVLAMVQRRRYSRVVLQPLMVTAGKHTDNEIAGEGPESWKSRFEAAGYEVICRRGGIGRMDKICELYAEHARAAIQRLEEA